MTFGIKSRQLPVNNNKQYEDIDHTILKGLAHATWMLHLTYQKEGRKLTVWQNGRVELVNPDPEAMHRKFLEFK